MTATILVGLIAGMNTSDKVWITGAAGASLARMPHARLSAGIEWTPFPDDAWGGLGLVAAGVDIMCTAAKNGNAALIVSVDYGRPRPGIWAGFQAGLGNAIGWGSGRQAGAVGLFLPTAALRLGYDGLAVKVLGFITSNGAPFDGEYFSVSVEGRWQL